jgi:hypothetical protein
LPTPQPLLLLEACMSAYLCRQWSLTPAWFAKYATATDNSTPKLNGGTVVYISAERSAFGKPSGFAATFTALRPAFSAYTGYGDLAQATPGAGLLLFQQLLAGQQVGSFSASATAVSSSGLVFVQIDGNSWMADACANMCLRKATECLSTDPTCEDKRCEPTTGG